VKRDYRRILGLVVAITLALGQSAGAVISTLDLTAQTPEQIANALVGAGVTISNVTYKGAANSAGTFTDGQAATGLARGVVLSTGDIANVIGPNLDEGMTTGNSLSISTSAGCKRRMNARVIRQLDPDRDLCGRITSLSARLLSQQIRPRRRSFE
jgi:hypothetical protein